MTAQPTTLLDESAIHECVTRVASEIAADHPDGVVLVGVLKGALIFLAATLYGFGKTFFWPTMLGVVSEQTPKGGALTLNAISGLTARRSRSSSLIDWRETPRASANPETVRS